MKNILLFLAMIILARSGPSCQIASRTYNIDYNSSEVIFPISSNYNFVNQRAGPSDVIINYSLRLLEFANCSINYTTAYTSPIRLDTRNYLAGTTCLIKEQLYFSLNLTVIGEANMINIPADTNFTQCTGWIYLNVTKPQPTPNPNLVKQISDLRNQISDLMDQVQNSSKNFSKTSQIQFIMTIITLVLICLVCGGLIFYCIKKNKKPQKRYKLLQNQQNSEKIDTNVKVDDYYIKQPEN